MGSTDKFAVFKSPHHKRMSLTQIFDPDTLSEMDDLALILAAEWPASHLPELYKMMGKEMFINFLDFYAGMNIRIPSKNEIEHTVRQHFLFKEYLKGVPSIKRLANRYGVPVSSAYFIIKNMEKTYKGLKNKIKKNNSLDDLKEILSDDVKEEISKMSEPPQETDVDECK